MEQAKISRFSILAFAAAIAALGLTFFNASGHNGQSSKTETAYERVMRTRTLRCGYALWPILEDMDPNSKQLKGMMPEFTEALAKKLDLKIDWAMEVQWGQEIEALKTNKIDAICSTDGAWNYSSVAFRDFTDPVAYYPVHLYGRKGETRFQNAENINSPDVTLSAMDGDISMTLAVEKYPKAHRLEVPGYGDPSLIVLNVLTGKADLAIEDAFTADRVNGSKGEKLERLSDKPYAIINSAFSVAKGETDLRRMLNQGFQLLQMTGVSDTILDKYDPDHRIFYRPQKLWLDK